MNDGRNQQVVTSWTAINEVKEGKRDLALRTIGGVVVIVFVEIRDRRDLEVRPRPSMTVCGPRLVTMVKSRGRDDPLGSG